MSTLNFFQSQDQIQRYISNFEETSEIHQFVGVVDGSHIPILAPGENKEDYFNCTVSSSYIRVTIGNSRYFKMLFLHASVGYPGSIYDLRVLQLSDIYQKI